jgi:NitT/TauT family transport system ATP-binding protein
MHVAVDVASFGYASQREVLHGVQVSLDRGETLAVLGGSGCGKSTLLRLIAGILPAKPEHRLSGSVTLFGEPARAYRGTGKLAFMFQEPTLFPNRTVRQNVALPLELRGGGDEALVDEMLAMVGLDEFAGYLPRQLSGGMRTRVAMARSFVTQPHLLLLDEPFAALDLTWKRELYASLADLRARFGTTIVMVTHDLQEAVYNANRILVLGRNGSPLDAITIERPLPRSFDFSDTVSEFTPQLEYLAHLITSDSVRKTTSRERALAVLETLGAAMRRTEPDGSADMIDLTPIRPFSDDPEISARLFHLWHVSTPAYRFQLVWDLLNFQGLSSEAHAEVARFILDNLKDFNRSTVSFYGAGSPPMILQAVEQRLRDVTVPAGKKWIYLCHLAPLGDLEEAKHLLQTVERQEDPRFVYPLARSVAVDILAQIEHEQETGVPAV